jgi:hypothetical protein
MPQKKAQSSASSTGTSSITHLENDSEDEFVGNKRPRSVTNLSPLELPFHKDTKKKEPNFEKLVEDKAKNILDVTCNVVNAGKPNTLLLSYQTDPIANRKDVLNRLASKKCNRDRRR